MHTDPSMTFADLLTRLAEAVDVPQYGTGTDNRMVTPTDPQTLDRLKRSINDGARELARAVHPKSGRAVRWSWLQPMLTVVLAPSADSALTINGDNQRYRLPPGVVSAPRGRVSWRDPSDGYGNVVRVVSYSRVVELTDRAPSQTGCPMYLGVTPYAETMGKSGTRPGFEMMVFPKPDLAYTTRARYTIQVLPLVEQNERGPWPPIHDLTVLDLAIAAWHRGTPEFERFRQQAEASVVRSVEHDALVWESSTEREDTDVYIRPITVSYNGSQILP